MIDVELLEFCNAVQDYPNLVAEFHRLQQFREAMFDKASIERCEKQQQWNEQSLKNNEQIIRTYIVETMRAHIK